MESPGPGQVGKTQASQPAKMKRHELVLSRVLVKEGFDGDQAQENMEATHQAQEEVEAQMEDAHGGQSPPQRITRSMFKALGARGQLFSLFVVSLVEGA